MRVFIYIVFRKLSEHGLAKSSCQPSMPISVHCTVINASEIIGNLEHLRPGQNLECKSQRH